MMALAGLNGDVCWKSRGSVCLWLFVPPELHSETEKNRAAEDRERAARKRPRWRSVPKIAA